MSRRLPPALAELAAALALEPPFAAILADLATAGDGSLSEPEILAVGWATVELERAELELDRRFGPAGWRTAAPDTHLGARARFGRAVVLLEPSTEGRLAATLARRGEGPCALYVARSWPSEPGGTDRPVGRPVSTATEGPLGPQRLVLGGPGWGPHLLLVGLPSPS